MIEFLTDNWQFVVAVICGVIELVLMLIFKKRPEVVDNSIVDRVIAWIRDAEKKFRLGSDKKQYVLECASRYLGSDYVEKDISDLIELILELPQKKGIRR